MLSKQTHVEFPPISNTNSIVPGAIWRVLQKALQSGSGRRAFNYLTSAADKEGDQTKNQLLACTVEQLGRRNEMENDIQSAESIADASFSVVIPHPKYTSISVRKMRCIESER